MIGRGSELLNQTRVAKSILRTDRGLLGFTHQAQDLPRQEIAFRAPNPPLVDQCMQKPALPDCGFGLRVFHPMPFDDSFSDAGIWSL
jgi:hypothetical protein